MSEPRKLLNLQEASELLHVHPNTLRRWDAQGVLTAVRFGPRQDRHYSQEAIDDFMKTSPAIQSGADIKTASKERGGEERLKQLERLANLLFQLDTPDRLAEQMSHELTKILKAQSCVILLKSEVQDELALSGQTGLPGYAVKRWERISVRDMLPACEAVNTREPVLLSSRIEHMKQYPLFAGRKYVPGGTMSHASLPLLIRGRAVGVISLNFNEQKQYSRDDVQFMLSVSRYCSWALERARLYEKEKQDKARTERLRVFLERINDSATNFFVPLTPDETYETIVEEAKKITGCVLGSIFLWQNNGLKRIYSSSPNLYGLNPRKKGRTYTTFLSRKPSVYHVRYTKEPHPLLNRLGIRSVIYVPLYYNTTTIGVMNILSQNVENWTPEGLKFLELYGRLASLAIHKTQLYFETKNSLENQRLYLSITSHEIKSPLAVMQGFIQLLDRKLAKADQAQRTIVDRITSEAKRLDMLVNEFLGQDGLQLTPEAYRWETVDLRAILDRAREDFSFSYPSHKVQVIDQIKESKCAIRGDKDKLLQVFINILGNAGKYSERGSKIIIRIELKEKQYRVSVKDAGRGIPAKDLKHIFRKFYRADRSEKGMGLGLYLVKTIIDNHRGEITISSKLYQGTTVAIQLPCYEKSGASRQRKKLRTGT